MIFFCVIVGSMKINRPFNQLSKSEYKHYIDNYKKYTDYNRLGLYRSLLENERLQLEDQLELRDYAHRSFQKSFDFLVLKDPKTYFEVSTLGEELTAGDVHQRWQDIKKAQQALIADKQLGHRNFGTYSKHICGIDWCPYDGVMVRAGSWLAGPGGMHFHTDRSSFSAKNKSKRFRKERKHQARIINDDLAEESEE